MSVSAEILEPGGAGRPAPGRFQSMLAGWRQLAPLRPPAPWHVIWVLAGSLAMTVLTSQLESSASEEVARARFDFRSAEIVRAIYGRMAAYEEVLRGGLGLFVATGDVTRAAWRSYVDTLRISRASRASRGSARAVGSGPGTRPPTPPASGPRASRNSPFIRTTRAPIRPRSPTWSRSTSAIAGRSVTTCGPNPYAGRRCRRRATPAGRRSPAGSPWSRRSTATSRPAFSCTSLTTGARARPRPSPTGAPPWSVSSTARSAWAI